MTDKFQIITGTPGQVEERLNTLLEGGTYVKVITTCGTSKDLVVTCFVKPHKNGKKE